MCVAVSQWADEHTVMIKRIKIPFKTLTELLVDFCHILLNCLTLMVSSLKFLKVKSKRGPL